MFATASPTSLPDSRRRKAAALAQSAASSGTAASAPAGDDGVVDADFTEIPDDERK